MKIYDSIINLIGNTPLLKIPIINTPCYAKLEYLNPGGSIKDRSALYMIEKAEKNNLIQKGGTIIEASSGNQGAATAMIAKQKGYRVIITLSEKVSEEKKSIFQAYGVELVTCKGTSDFNDPEHYWNVAKKLSKEIENSYFLNQYFNQDNSDAHYYGIAPEIYNQIGERVTHIFIAMGSGGTANGITRYIKEKNKAIKIIGVDSANGFIATKGHPKAYYLDGMGTDYNTPFFNASLFDDTVFIEDEEAHQALQILSHKYGFLVGPSSGGVIAAILKYQDKFEKNDCIVTLFSDSGRAYLSRKYHMKKSAKEFIYSKSLHVDNTVSL